jgi:hypothetical protein
MPTSLTKAFVTGVFCDNVALVRNLSHQMSNSGSSWQSCYSYYLKTFSRYIFD